MAQGDVTTESQALSWPGRILSRREPIPGFPSSSLFVVVLRKSVSICILSRPLTFSRMGGSFSPYQPILLGSCPASQRPHASPAPALDAAQNGGGFPTEPGRELGSVKPPWPGPSSEGSRSQPHSLSLCRPWLLLPEVQHPVKITYAQYEKYLKADNMIRTTAVCQVSDEAEVLVERDIILDNPNLTLEVKGAEGVPPRPARPCWHPPEPQGNSFPAERGKEQDSGPASATWVGQSSRSAHVLVPCGKWHTCPQASLVLGPNALGSSAEKPLEGLLGSLARSALSTCCVLGSARRRKQEESQGEGPARGEPTAPLPPCWWSASELGTVLLHLSTFENTRLQNHGLLGACSRAPIPATSHMSKLRPREEKGTAVAARARAGPQALGLPAQGPFQVSGCDHSQQQHLG